MNSSSARGYFEKLGCRVGYLLLLNGSQHFGLYPVDLNNNFSEADAQSLHHDELAKHLQLQAGMHVLDAGCGQGFVSCDLASRYRIDVTGVDITPYILTRAKRRAEKMKVASKTHYFIGDYTQLHFPDCSFDRIYTVETLCHANDLPRVLSEFHRVLKPSGRIVFMEYRFQSTKNFSAHAKKMHDLIVEGTHSPSLFQFEGNAFVQLLSATGFHNVSVMDKSAAFLPSLERLYKYAKFPYALVSLLRLQRYFINLTIAVEYYKIATKGLIGYAIYSAVK